MDTPFFELRNISKYFARVVANKDISFSIQRGEVLALLGENGAGKSTVMKILYGLYKADEGQIFMDGKEQKIGSPKDAMALGISMCAASLITTDVRRKWRSWQGSMDLISLWMQRLRTWRLACSRRWRY